MLVLMATLSGCGLAGYDAYGRPDPCAGPARPIQTLDGTVTCDSSQDRFVVTGEASPDDPTLARNMTALATELRRTVLYTDGKTARTFEPGEASS